MIPRCIKCRDWAQLKLRFMKLLCSVSKKNETIFPAVMWLLMKLSPTNPHLKQFEASGVSLGRLLSQRYELRPLSKDITQQATARLN